MANAVGALLVRLGLDDVEYKTGLTKAELQAQRFAKKLETNMATAGRVAGIALGAVAVAGVAAFAVLRREIDNVASFKQFSEQIGDTAEAFAGLKMSSATSGVAMDAIAAASIKLTAGLSKTDDESKGAAHAIRQLGIDVDEFKKKSPVAQLEDIAVHLAKFEDGAGKTAFAVAAMGKAGAQMLPFLNDLAEAGGRNAKLTQDQIELADRYVKQQARTRAEIEQLIQVVAVESLPAFNAFIGALTDTMKAMLGLDGGTSKLKGNDVAQWATTTAKALAFVVDAGEGVARVFQVAGASLAAFLAPKSSIALAKDVWKDYSRDVDAILNRPLFSDRLAARLALPPPAKAVARPVLDPRRFAIPGAVGAGAMDDTARRIRDAQLKDLDRAIKAEEDLLRDREHFLNQYYQDDKLSIADYYAGRQNALDEAVSKQRAAYAEEQRIVTAFRPKDEKERIANQEKLADVIDKTSRFETDAARTYIDMTFEKERATKQFQESIERLSIALAAARGDTVGAAGRGFDLNNRRFRDQLEASGMSTADLDEDRKRTTDRERLTKATEDYHQVLDRLGISQERIDILARSGAIGEIESLNRRDELARKYIVTLTAQADAYEKIANAMNAGPEKSRALLEVDRMRLGIEQLGEQTDGLAKKLNAGFGDSVADHLARIADGTESVRDGFKGMLKDWTHMLNQMAAKQVATTLFGQGGSAAGIGGLLASLFGGTAGAGAATSASWTAMSAATIPSFAGGTNYAPGGTAWVGEHGKELVNLPRGSQVIPNSELTARREARGNTYIINAPVAPGTTRQSVAQAAGELRRVIMMTERNS